jgi:hypothetical protein
MVVATPLAVEAVHSAEVADLALLSPRVLSTK